MRRTCEHCGAPINGKTCLYCGMPYASRPKKAAGRRRPIWPWICAGTMVVVVAVTAVMYNGRDWMQAQFLLWQASLESRRTASTDSVSARERTTTSDATASTYDAQETGIYPSGTYLVGTDIPAGEYLLVSSISDEYRNFYAGVYTDPACESDSQISGQSYAYSAIVTLEEGMYFDFSWAICYDRTKNDVPNDPTEHPGMFEVGVDLEPGTYTLAPREDYASYQIFAELSTVAPIIVDSNRATEQTQITLEEGEYLYLQQCVIDA